jgi:hypothetical protein
MSPEQIPLLREFVRFNLATGLISECLHPKALLPISATYKSDHWFVVCHDISELNNFFNDGHINHPNLSLILERDFNCASIIRIDTTRLCRLSEEFSDYFAFRLEDRCFKFNFIPSGWKKAELYA